MIDVSAIEVAVRAAVASCTRVEMPPNPDFPGLTSPIIKLQSDDGAHLASVLKEQAELAMFDGRHQVFGAMSSQVQLEQLAEWLVRRACVVGEREATEGLARYADKRKFPVTEVVVLVGVLPEHRVTLGSGIDLVPISDLPLSPQTEMLRARNTVSFGGPDPSGSAALLYALEVPVVHSNAASFETMRARLWEEREARQAELDDARLVLSAVGPCAPRTLISWEAIPAWVPLSDRAAGWGTPLPDAESFSVEPLDSRALELASELVQSFKRLGQKDSDRVRIALHRLNLSLRKVRPVDRAIDLGICLESLFLSDTGSGSGELKFRMRLRAARYLGLNADEREQIYDFVGELYDLRSEAVHSGRLKKDEGSLGIRDALQKGTNLGAKTLQRVIREGFPDWEKLIHT